jgi:hypothetical protein
MRANSLDLIDSGSTTWGASRTTAAATGSAKARTPHTPRDIARAAPRVNPYAAPQTIDRPVDISKLPVATFAENEGTRQLFPEQSTAVLVAMARRVKALDDVQVVWFVLGSLAAVSGCLLSMKIDRMLGVPAAFFATMALIRWQAGVRVHRSDRYLAIVTDALLLAGSFYLGVLAFQRAAHLISNDFQSARNHVILNLVLLMLIALPCLFYVGSYSLRSLKALIGGKFLFGPERLKHEDLLAELRYRQEWGIE